MKKLYLPLFALTLVAPIAVATSAYATTFTATATVIQGFSVAQSQALNFGQFAAGSAAGTVIVPVSGAATTTSGVSLQPVSSAKPGIFTITGPASTAYTATISSTVTLAGPGPSMVANLTLTSTPGTVTLAGNTSTSTSLTVGGTLAVGTAAAQTLGGYSGTYDVTVSF